jgi:hypothetical protein
MKKYHTTRSSKVRRLLLLLHARLLHARLLLLHIR